MNKYIYDENNGLWYELQGDYYLPCLTLPPEEEKPIGIWGQRHKRYLKEHRKATYTTLLTSGKLNAYLAEVDQQAQERFERLIGLVGWVTYRRVRWKLSTKKSYTNKGLAGISKRDIRHRFNSTKPYILRPNST